MTEREFVDQVLRVPVTRIGFMYVVEAIEYLVDTRDTKFYPKLAELTGKSTRALEKPMREAKNLGLQCMNKVTKDEMFPEGAPTTTEYILRATEYYRRKYHEKQEER